MKLQNKVAIITGGGKGIGAEISLRLAKEGAKIVIAEKDIESAENINKKIIENKGDAIVVDTNVSNEDSVNQMAEAAIKKFGKIDILINNAGIAHVGNIESCEEEDLDRLYNINIKGVYNCSKVCIPFMKNNGGGVILNMASIASSVGISDRFAYSMTKGAVLTMTYSIAKDYINHNIRCNCISPARVHTPFVDGFIKENYPGKESEMFENLSKTQPIGRMGIPQEIADLALFLCSNESSFITGSNYGIDGGYVTLNSK